ncbi:MAG: hypothetical protein JEY96_13905 [Bacteroidales bacterium]|nr:hypothetical protein [Bacteroidales bacterium]
MRKTLILISILSAILLLSCKTTKESLQGNSSEEKTEHNQKSTLKDGSSFKSAIVVSSIAEEYKYAQKACPDCQFVGQTLVYERKTPYDILTFVKPDGEEIEYFFDISKFYGKF